MQGRDEVGGTHYTLYGSFCRGNKVVTHKQAVPSCCRQGVSHSATHCRPCLLHDAPPSPGTQVFAVKVIPMPSTPAAPRAAMRMAWELALANMLKHNNIVNVGTAIVH